MLNATLEMLLQVRHLDGIVDWVYDGFLDIVATHRKLPREEVQKASSHASFYRT